MQSRLCAQGKVQHLGFGVEFAEPLKEKCVFRFGLQALSTTSEDWEEVQLDNTRSLKTFPTRLKLLSSAADARGESGCQGKLF